MHSPVQNTKLKGQVLQGTMTDRNLGLPSTAWSSHVALGSTTWERLKALYKQLAYINKAVARALVPHRCKLFVPLTSQDRENVLTMVKHLRAQCQSCRKNSKEIQSQKAVVDGFSSELNTAILPPNGRGSYTLARGEENSLFCGWHLFTWDKLQHRILFKHCLPVLADVLEEILLQDFIFTWWEYTIVDSWKTNCVHLENILKVSCLQRTCNRTLEIWNRSHEVSRDMTG